jgi:steroid delta-isomerase-like uncharacterized protein
MSTATNKAIVRRYYEEVYNRKNLGVIDELIADDYTAYLPGGIEPLRGRAGRKQANMLHLGAFPDLRLTIEDEIAEGDKVVQRLTIHGTHQGEFMGTPATGKQVRCTGIHISRLAGGKIVEQWGEFDGLGILQQLGVMPTPGQGGE